jgi:hypothetical protein
MGNPAGGVEFGAMALAIVEAQCLAGEPFLARNGQDDGGVHPATQENYS